MSARRIRVPRSRGVSTAPARDGRPRARHDARPPRRLRAREADVREGLRGRRCGGSVVPRIRAAAAARRRCGDRARHVLGGSRPRLLRSDRGRDRIRRSRAARRLRKDAARLAAAEDRGDVVAIELNHTIVPTRDALASARFLTEILGLPAPARFGPFWTVRLANGVTLDYQDSDEQLPIEHYAFLVSEDEFDEIF